MNRDARVPRLLLVPIVFLLSLLVLGCGTSDDDPETTGSETTAESSAPSTGDIVIGASIPLSGPSGEEGERIQKGLELAVEQINEDGGVNGKTLALDVQDDEGDPATGVGLVDRFEQDGAVAIVGTYNSPVALAMSDGVRRAGIPHVVAAVSNAIAEEGNPFQFMTTPTDVQQIQGIVNFLEERGLERPALMTDTTDLGSLAEEPLTQALTEAGMEPVAAETFEVDASDLTPQLLSIKNADADSIVMWTVGGAYARAMQGLQQIGYSVPVIGTAATSDPAVARIAGEAADELYYQDVMQPDKPQVVELNEAWAEKYPDDGEIPFIAMLSADIIAMIAECAEESEDDPRALQRCLETYSSTERAAGAEGSVWKYSRNDHEALTADDLVLKVYDEGEVVTADEGEE